jgi:hypothetical protein
MIFGKINPVAEIANPQTNPFTPTTVTGSYITGIARPYYLGSNVVEFQVSYGDCVFDESGSVTGFNTVFNTSTQLSGSAIADWGTDDSSILTALAEQQGTTIVEIVSGSNFRSH